jgi:hypothetical protein
MSRPTSDRIENNLAASVWLNSQHRMLTDGDCPTLDFVCFGIVITFNTVLT